MPRSVCIFVVKSVGNKDNKSFVSVIEIIPFEKLFFIHYIECKIKNQ